jgi:DNA (cytosine-5)-methyltransferase 1
MTFGSLFSGIGGIDLGLERAGMTCAWQSEIDPYACRVLKKHWPSVPNLGDITQIKGDDVEPVNILCGGFPCQDISQTATGWERPGTAGTRSGLWRHFARLINDIRPQWVIVENVGAIRYRGRGFDRVLRDLAAIGYDAEWEVFPAASVGAPHKRARLWLVAHPHDGGEPDRPIYDEARILSQPCPTGGAWADPPADIRVDDGVPDRMDRLRGLGNAVVPQAAEWVGRRIMEMA